MTVLSTQTLSVKEAAQHASVHPNTIRKWIADGILPAWRPGTKGRYRILTTDLEGVLGAVSVPIAREA